MTGIDARRAFRLFAKDPVYVLTVVLVMALGIGCCAAIFTLVEAVLLTRLPYSEPERIAIIWHTNADSSEVVGVWARDYATYRDTTLSFESVAAVTTQGYNLSTGIEPSRVTCGRVTWNMLPMLGTTPLRGRLFTKDDDSDALSRTVILSEDLWRSRFGSDPAILGKTIRLDLLPHVVVAVMPGTFAFPPEGVRNVSKSECWVPASFSPAEMAMPAFNWVVLGRLKPGIGLGEAQQDASAVAKRILDSYPAAVQKEVALRARVVSIQNEVTRRSRTPLLVFAGCVAFLLLIGCANVANLGLAKFQARQREMAIRGALGATRGSLTRQLLFESITLACCGGLAGFPVTFGMLRLLVILNPGGIPALDRIRMDLSVLLFTMACSIFSGVLAGLAPALRARVVDLPVMLAEGNRGAGSLRQSRLRSGLVVVEIGMAFVLLSGAGLLLRTYAKLASVPPGFDPDNVMTFSIALPEASYADPVRARRFVESVLQHIRGFGRNTSASAGSSLPIGSADATVFSRIGAPPATAGFKPAFVHTVTDDYLQVWGIRALRGRLFEPADDVSRRPVALINEAMAEQYWPDTEAIGKQFYWLVGGRNLTIVGVVADVRQDGLATAAAPAFYVPLAQSPLPVRNLTFAIRTGRPAPGLARQIRTAVAETDSALPVFSIQSANDIIWNSISDERFHMFVVAAFAICALVLAASGLYAVISYLVIDSSRELGIRMALGAGPGRILSMVMARGLRLLVAGLALGSTTALMLTRFMSNILFGITSADHVTFLGVIAVLAPIAILAILIPAIRATKSNPLALHI